MSWLDQVVEEVSRRGLDRRVVDVCRAFGGDVASGLIEPTPTLARRIVDVLADEVDRDQAELFSRRFTSLAEMLAALEAPESELLHIGLHGRIDEILAADRPRALRVRACVDFYTSHAALLHHARPGLPSAPELLAEAKWHRVETGLSHTLVEGLTDQGPIRVNLLRVDPRRSFRCVDLRRGRLGRPLAAVTGGFFLYSEPNVEPPFERGEPVGMLIQDGHVQVPPILRRAALFRKGSERYIQPRSLEGWRVLGVMVRAVNDPSLMRRVPVVFNRAYGPMTPRHGGHAIAFAHGHRLEDAPGQLPIPMNGFVLSLPAGDAVPDGLDVDWPVNELDQAMAGGPMLLKRGEVTLDLAREDFTGDAPPITFSRDETFDQNLLPRMVVGLRDQTLFFAAIDGRNFERAPGMTLGQSAMLLRSLRCSTAMNLDGGSSKRMWVKGKEVDLSSTELITGSVQNERKRPIRTAIVIE
ncbi:MAG: phosphodiester glycosidase family protein [Proteobacteria bacterium]|nr:phosphodiester glycosidase family protein [Pseudomonadota bacterium]MCP4916695.1 phosphodiester glycosidase family protein [Pseudomonadota bacterium]